MSCESIESTSSAPKPDTRFWHPERVPVVVVNERSDVTPVDGLPPLDVAPAPAELVGMQLPGSRLKILERINDGGCGVVYRGEHTELRRPVAIKVQRLESPGTREMFLDEARATTRIESPHVVQVVDFGELVDGRVWYAMELLGGRSLDVLIAEERGRVDLARAFALLRMACKGLGAAHAAGLVHRDVKPQNLVVVERAGREHVVLVDFGISIELGATPTELCGTPAYMAREQMVRGPLDARTDVYGWGCCAYELLTGRSMIDGCTISEDAGDDDHGMVPTFTGVTGVPLALQELVRRCLAVEPSGRVADMVELEALLCEVQIAARIPNARDDLELPAVDRTRRERIAAGFAALARRTSTMRRRWVLPACVAASAIGAFAIWPRASASNEASAAGAELAAAAVVSLADRGAADEPAGMAIPANLLAEGGELGGGDAVAVVETPMPALDDAKPDVGDEVVEEPVLEPVAAPPAPAASAPGRTARDAIREGNRALRRGNYGGAEHAFTRALRLDPRSGKAAAGLADVNFEQGRHARARHYAQLAVRADPRSAAHRLRLGDAYYRLGRDGDARKEYVVAQKLGSNRATSRLDALSRAGR